MSLYEVSDIQPGQSFLARDLLRGGEPIHVTEHTATKTIKPWDRLAMRIVEVRGKTVIGGGLLPFEHQLADKMISTFAGTKKRIAKDAPAFFDELGLDAGDPEVDRLITSATSDSELLRVSAPLFSTLFLVDLLDRVLDPKLPQLANSDGEEMEFIALVYRLKDAADGRRLERPSIRRPTSMRPRRPSGTGWRRRTPRRSRAHGERARRSATRRPWVTAPSSSGPSSSRPRRWSCASTRKAAPSAGAP